MAKSSKTKAPKEVKNKTLTTKESAKKAQGSVAKPIVPEKSKSKDKGKGKAKVIEPEPVLESSMEEDEDQWEDEEEDGEDEVVAAASSDQEPASDSEEEEEDDDEGVDEEGMERLLKALGEDGLDDLDRKSVV